jgi:hypothetical protein
MQDGSVLQEKFNDPLVRALVDELHRVGYEHGEVRDALRGWGPSGPALLRESYLEPVVQLAEDFVRAHHAREPSADGDAATGAFEDSFVRALAECLQAKGHSHAAVLNAFATLATHTESGQAQLRAQCLDPLVRIVERDLNLIVLRRLRRGWHLDHGQLQREQLEADLSRAVADALHERGHAYGAISSAIRGIEGDRWTGTGEDGLWSRQLGPLLDKLERLLSLDGE